VIGERIDRVATDDPDMNKLEKLAAAAIMLASLGPATALARDIAVSRSASLPHITQGGPARIVWYYDGRDDVRDFPTNGFFPGDFAANPASAAIGAAGIFGSTPSRASNRYPSQVVTGSRRPPSHCVRRHRSYDRAPGTFLAKDHTRHRC
jgi:hypothetical protein